MSMIYEILENNTVEIFYDGSDVPAIRQPNYPNGEPFESRASAESWANLYIQSVEDENAPFAPDGPGIPGKPKPSKEEIEQLILAQKAVDQARTKEEYESAVEAIKNLLNR